MDVCLHSCQPKAAVKLLHCAPQVPILAVPGVEADDVVGSLAAKAAGDGFDVVIVSTDQVWVGAWEQRGRCGALKALASTPHSAATAC